MLWASADKLRAQMDAAEYKHLVLGLIFLKYISDTFEECRTTVLERVSDPAEFDDYLGDDPAEHQEALEDRDYLYPGQRILGACQCPLGAAEGTSQATGDRATG